MRYYAQEAVDIVNKTNLQRKQILFIASQINAITTTYLRTTFDHSNKTAIVVYGKKRLTCRSHDVRMQETCTNGIQDETLLNCKDYPEEIVQEIKI